MIFGNGKVKEFTRFFDFNYVKQCSDFSTRKTLTKRRQKLQGNTKLRKAKNHREMLLKSSKTLKSSSQESFEF